MTAEIAILNRHAVALAADSAVTVSGGGTNKSKVYDTANKLFALSSSEPIGVMFYGNGSLLGIPWETIIKIYRKGHSEKTFATVRDY